MTPTLKQQSVCEELLTQIKWFQSSNDINSPSLEGNIMEELNQNELLSDEERLKIQNSLYPILNLIRNM